MATLYCLHPPSPPQKRGLGDKTFCIQRPYGCDVYPACVRCWAASRFFLRGVIGFLRQVGMLSTVIYSPCLLSYV